MGILSKRLGIQALSLEDPSQPLLPPSALFESLGLGRSDAGVLINETQAMRIATAQACVRVISEDLSSTGHEIIQTFPDQSVQTARDHRLWRVIHDEPNRNMSAKVFWGCLLAGELLWGNGYAWIKRDKANRVIELVPLASGKTSPVKINGKLMYGTTQTDTGHVAYLETWEVLHQIGLTLDGIVGLSPINTCKNAFGLAMAAEKFGAQLFGNGVLASGVFTHPEVLEEEAYDKLVKSIREMATGENAQRPMILEEGMQWKQMTIPPNEAQFLETRRYQRSEIAGLFRVPMHLLQDLMRATNNNIEHQSLDYVRYCLRPRAVGIEQEVNRKLLGGPFTMEHNLNDMQRGDLASQTASFQALAAIGAYSIDDTRRKLRENPIGEDAGGNLRFIQGAMRTITSYLPGSVDAQEVPIDAPDGTQPFDWIVTPYRNFFREAGKRIARSKSGPHFARKLVEDIVASMAQAMLARRFGECSLTNKEQKMIEAVTVTLTDGSLGPINEHSAVYACQELSKEIL